MPDGSACVVLCRHGQVIQVMDARRADDEKPLVQRGFRINKEASEEASVSRGSVSELCLTTNGPDFVRAWLVPSEIQTVGEMNVNKAFIAATMRRDSDSDTPWSVGRAAYVCHSEANVDSWHVLLIARFQN